MSAPGSNVTCRVEDAIVDRVRGAFCDCTIPTAFGWYGKACELWQGTDDLGAWLIEKTIATMILQILYRCKMD